MNYTKMHQQIALLVVAASLLAAPMALADVVTDWNIKAGEIVVEAKLGPPPANRVLAIVHTATATSTATTRPNGIRRGRRSSTPPCTPSIRARTASSPAAVGTVLQAEIGTGPMPTLTTTSVTAKGAARSWTKIDDFMQEVANARIYDGVHYRNSTEVGTAMGKQVGELVVAKYLRPLK